MVLPVAEGGVELAVECEIHFWKTDILKSKNALDVVKSHEDSIHAANPHLKRVLQKSRSDHVVILSFKGLVTPKPVLDLVPQSMLEVFGIHSDRDHGTGLQIK